jgi:hypothetical protein
MERTAPTHANARRRLPVVLLSPSPSSSSAPASSAPLLHNPLAPNTGGGRAIAAGSPPWRIAAAATTTTTTTKTRRTTTCRPIAGVVAALAAAASVLCLAAGPFLFVGIGEGAIDDVIDQALGGIRFRQPVLVDAARRAAAHHGEDYQPQQQQQAEAEAGPTQPSGLRQEEGAAQLVAASPPKERADEARGDEGSTRRGRAGDKSDEAEAEASGASEEEEEASDAPPQAADDAADDGGDRFHLVFSTGCSPFQNWQAYVFFHRALVVKQPGIVTRIASGCSARQRLDRQAFFDEHVATMTTTAAEDGPGSPGNFRIHFTPDFSSVKEGGEPYQYYNKPFGVRHWMENVLGYNSSHDNNSNSGSTNEHDNTIIVLLDPDELLLRPFAKNDFSDARWVHSPRREGGGGGGDDAPRWTRVEPGKPIGQRYGYDLQWKRKINMTLVVSPDESISPVDEMSDEEAKEGYVVGPPLLATARDLYNIVTQWTRFVPLVHDQYPHLLAEMVRASCAAMLASCVFGMCVKYSQPHPCG